MSTKIMTKKRASIDALFLILLFTNTECKTKNINT